MDEETNNLLNKVYFSKTGYGSLENTFKDAKTKDPNITRKKVKEWFEANVEKKRQVGGQKNSYVAPNAYHEYQADLFFITDRQFPDQEYPFGLSVIDVFTKYASVIPLKERKFPDVRDGLIKAFDDIGKRPQILYTDEEGALMEKRAAPFFEELDIQHIVTTGSAHFVERFNRTFKNMINAQMKHLGRKKKLSTKTPVPEKPQWHKLIPLVLAVYNNKNIHSSTGKTPTEAKKSSSEVDVKASLELRAKFGRKFPELSVGDSVRILRKKKAVGDKEFMSNFKAGTQKVESISENFGQKFYRLSPDGREYIRSDIVKV